ncbi:MAG: VWA domain-containing protein [Waddliaceae bacterium]
MFRFYWPWFVLLLPLPYLVAKLFPSAKTGGKPSAPKMRFPAVERLKRAFPYFRLAANQVNRGFYFLLSLVWALLVVALMQPERVNHFTQVNNKGYDLMLAVDISASMQALDFSTPLKTISRLDMTKEVVGSFVLGRRGDRVGLIVFGESAYLHVPLTLDTLSVSHLLNEVASGMAGKATAIGDAIGLSVRTLRERPEGSRVLILLTDGEDNASSIPPMEAAKLAKQYGIRVYTIGVGKNGPVPFPTNFGGYQMVQVSLDEDLLRQIASMTDGRYYRATDGKALQAVYDKIDLLEKTEANQKELLIRDPLYPYPLGLALVFLLLLTFIQGYRKVLIGN